MRQQFGSERAARQAARCRSPQAARPIARKAEEGLVSASGKPSVGCMIAPLGAAERCNCDEPLKVMLRRKRQPTSTLSGLCAARQSGTMQPGKDSITLRGKILTSGEATQVISSSSPTPAKGHGTRNEAQRFILSAGPLMFLDQAFSHQPEY